MVYALVVLVKKAAELRMRPINDCDLAESSTEGYI